jgi:hypothetical protein
MRNILNRSHEFPKSINKDFRNEGPSIAPTVGLAIQESRSPLYAGIIPDI